MKSYVINFINRQSSDQHWPNLLPFKTATEDNPNLYQEASQQYVNTVYACRYTAF